MIWSLTFKYVYLQLIEFFLYLSFSLFLHHSLSLLKIQNIIYFIVSRQSLWIQFLSVFLSQNADKYTLPFFDLKFDQNNLNLIFEISLIHGDTECAKGITLPRFNNYFLVHKSRKYRAVLEQGRKKYIHTSKSELFLAHF